MGTPSSGQRDTESGSSPNNQEDREGTNALTTKITKKDSTPLIEETQMTLVLTKWCHMLFFFHFAYNEKIIPTSF